MREHATATMARPRPSAATARLRRARVGERLRHAILDRSRARRIDATALVLPGADGTEAYLAALDAAADDFAAWDGRVVALPPDAAAEHRVLVVDRYGQVYDAVDARAPAGLPAPAALEEWFKFLATACPECGVIDDPVREGPTP